MRHVIHIFGASGSGTTTLGKKICEELGYFKKEETEKAISLCEEISKMLNTLIIKLKENTSSRAEGASL